MKLQPTYPVWFQFLNKALLILLLTQLLFSAKSQQVIEVGGIISENTSWTSNNIYLVFEDVRVISGIELVIEAGTLVKFNQGRSLIIESGKLKIAGTGADSVRLVPNHTGIEDWNWGGIAVITVSEPGSVLIEHARIEKAVSAIRSVAGNHMIIRHCSMVNNRNIGISIANSSYCLFEHNDVSRNFFGMEIYASGPGNMSANNVIRGNKFHNEVTNLLIHNDNHGACPYNIIEENLVIGALNGLWISNSANGGTGHATISRNIIINNGSENDGYGLYLSMDSTVVSNNIFWQNTTAADINLSLKSHFLNNSVYQNKTGLIVRNNSRELMMLNNTFTGNKGNVITFGAHRDMALNQNNIFNNEQESGIVRNQTFANINARNNFWGTTNDSIIQQLLFDKKDNPNLGFLLYEPFLSEPDTSAPVSPPHRTISQLISGSVRLTWNANPETNLAGYRVYSGQFSHYHFSNSSGLITDTTFTIPGGNINSLFAVTALITNGQQPQAQLNGHESPFAFATPFPYAGADTTVCANLSAFVIQQSTLPFSLDSIFWETSGDGNFDDAFVLRTAYFPGESDIENGKVRLTLNATSGGSILSHAFNLTFEPSPVVITGDDTIISPDSVYSTAGAFAANYDQILWETSGDGVFLQTDSLNTIYIPGNQDISSGEVLLILNVFSQYCGMDSDTIKLIIREFYTVEGRVWAGNELLPNTPVLAVMINEDADLPGRALTFTTQEGKFRFNQIFAGEYVFYAPVDTATLPGYLPSYHAQKIRWQQAFLHEIRGNTYEIDIRLPLLEVHLPAGQGSISGQFLLPELSCFCLQAYCTPWFGSTGEEFCNEGLSNVSILLYSLSRQKVYRHTLTDANGKFYFGSLPYGTYILEAEIADYQSAVSAELVISPQQETITDILLQIEAEKKISITVPEKLWYPSDLHVFPNPSRDYLILTSDWLDDLQNYEIVIFDLPGSVVRQVSANTSGAGIRIETGGLENGFYFGKLTKGSDYRYFRFLKH